MRKKSLAQAYQSELYIDVTLSVYMGLQWFMINVVK